MINVLLCIIALGLGLALIAFYAAIAMIVIWFVLLFAVGHYFGGVGVVIYLALSVIIAYNIYKSDKEAENE